jgi:hypothetical protein
MTRRRYPQFFDLPDTLASLQAEERRIDEKKKPKVKIKARKPFVPCDECDEFYIDKTGYHCKLMWHCKHS